MSDAQLRSVLPPKRSEVHILADLPSAVHLHGLAFQLGKLQLYRSAWVVSRHFKLKFEGIPNQVMDKSASALPLGAVLVGCELEPIIIFLLIVVDVGD